MIDSSSIIIPKSLNPVCATRAGWVAIVTYQQQSDSSDGDSGSSSSSGASINNPSFQNKPFIEEQVIESQEWHENDQAQIDISYQYLNNGSITSGWSLTKNLNGTYTLSYLPENKYGPGLILVPKRLVTTYKTVEVPNPNYYQTNALDNTRDAITLKDLNKQSKWNYDSYSLYNQNRSKQIYPQYLIASADFVYCGCCNCQLVSSDNCISLASIATLVLQYSSLTI